MCVSSSLEILLNRILIVNRKLGADPNRKLGANNDVWYQPHGTIPYVAFRSFAQLHRTDFYGMVPTMTIPIKKSTRKSTVQ